MSTKIYNGYVLPKLSFQELLDFCIDFRDKARLIKTEEYNKGFIEEYIRTIDKLTLNEKFKEKYLKDNKKSYGNNLFVQLIWSINDEAKDLKNKNLRNTDFDLESSASFFPLEDKILCLFYCENKEISKLWEENKNIKEYHYQNSSDKPKNITKKDWQKRSDEWNYVLEKDGWGKPIDNGFNFTFTTDTLPYSIEKSEILKYLPSFEDRLTYEAKDIFLNNYVKENNSNSDNTFHWLFKGLDKLKTEEGILELEKIKEDIKDKLVENIDEDFILNYKIDKPVEI